MSSISFPAKSESSRTIVTPFDGEPMGKTKVSNVKERIKAWREFYEPLIDDSNDQS